MSRFFTIEEEPFIIIDSDDEKKEEIIKTEKIKKESNRMEKYDAKTLKLIEDIFAENKNKNKFKVKNQIKRKRMFEIVLSLVESIKKQLTINHLLKVLNLYPNKKDEIISQINRELGDIIQFNRKTEMISFKNGVDFETVKYMFKNFYKIFNFENVIPSDSELHISSIILEKIYKSYLKKELEKFHNFKKSKIICEVLIDEKYKAIYFGTCGRENENISNYYVVIHYG
jgi:hypothetical protein